MVGVCVRVWVGGCVRVRARVRVCVYVCVRACACRFGGGGRGAHEGGEEAGEGARGHARSMGGMYMVRICACGVCAHTRPATGAIEVRALDGVTESMIAIRVPHLMAMVRTRFLLVVAVPQAIGMNG